MTRLQAAACRLGLSVPRCATCLWLPSSGRSHRLRLGHGVSRLLACDTRNRMMACGVERNALMRTTACAVACNSCKRADVNSMHASTDTVWKDPSKLSHRCHCLRMTTRSLHIMNEHLLRHSPRAVPCLPAQRWGQAGSRTCVVPAVRTSRTDRWHPASITVCMDGYSNPCIPAFDQ